MHAVYNRLVQVKLFPIDASKYNLKAQVKMDSLEGVVVTENIRLTEDSYLSELEEVISDVLQNHHNNIGKEVPQVLKKCGVNKDALFVQNFEKQPWTTLVTLKNNGLKPLKITTDKDLHEVVELEIENQNKSKGGEHVLQETNFSYIYSNSDIDWNGEDSTTPSRPPGRPPKRAKKKAFLVDDADKRHYYNEEFVYGAACERHIVDLDEFNDLFNDELEQDLVRFSSEEGVEKINTLRTSLKAFDERSIDVVCLSIVALIEDADDNGTGGTKGAKGKEDDDTLLQVSYIYMYTYIKP